MTGSPWARRQMKTQAAMHLTSRSTAPRILFRWASAVHAYAPGGVMAVLALLFVCQLCSSPMGVAGAKIAGTRTRYYSEEHRRIGRAGIAAVQKRIPKDLNLYIDEESVPELIQKRTARLHSIACVDKEDNLPLGGDEVFFVLLADGKEVLRSEVYNYMKKGVRIPRQPTDEFTFTRTFEVLVYEQDMDISQIDADDVLGRLTFHSGMPSRTYSNVIVNEEMVSLMSASAEYEVEVELKGDVYHPSDPFATFYTIQLTELQCKQQEDFTGEDSIILEMLIDERSGSSTNRFTKNIDIGTGTTVKIDAPDKNIENSVTFKLTEKDALDSDDVFKTKRWYLRPNLPDIGNNPAGVGVDYSVKMTHGRAEYVIHFRVQWKAIDSRKNNYDQVHFMAETNGLPLFYADVVALAGDFFASSGSSALSNKERAVRGSISVDLDANRQRSAPEASTAFLDTFSDWYDRLDDAYWQKAIPRYLALFDIEKTLIGRIRTRSSKSEVNKVYENEDCKTLECISNSLNTNLGRVSTGKPASVSFHHNRGSQVASLRQISDAPYSVAAIMNFDHFNTEALIAYRAGHNNAVLEACKAGKAYRSEDTDTARKHLARAFAMNAHADHFGTDQFSAGHIRNPRGQMFFDRFKKRCLPSTDERLCNLLINCVEDKWESAKDLSVRNKYFHDEDSLLGVPVRSKNGSDKWIAYGDTLLMYDKNSHNREKAEQFVTVSAGEIMDAFEGTGSWNCSHCGACVEEANERREPENHIPVYDPERKESGKLVAKPPYFTNVHGTWYKREEATDALDPSPLYCVYSGGWELKSFPSEKYLEWEHELDNSYFEVVDANGDQQVDYREFYDWAQETVPQLRPTESSADIDFETQTVLAQMYLKIAAKLGALTISRDAWLSQKVSLKLQDLKDVEASLASTAFHHDDAKPGVQPSSASKSTFLQLQTRQRKLLQRKTGTEGVLQSVSDILQSNHLTGLISASLPRFVSAGLRQLADQRSRQRRLKNFTYSDRVKLFGARDPDKGSDSAPRLPVDFSFVHSLTKPAFVDSKRSATAILGFAKWSTSIAKAQHRIRLTDAVDITEDKRQDRVERLRAELRTEAEKMAKEVQRVSSTAILWQEMQSVAIEALKARLKRDDVSEGRATSLLEIHSLQRSRPTTSLWAASMLAASQDPDLSSEERDLANKIAPKTLFNKVGLSFAGPGKRDLGDSVKEVLNALNVAV